MIDKSSFALFNVSTAAFKSSLRAAISFGMRKPSNIGMLKETDAEVLAEF